MRTLSVSQIEGSVDDLDGTIVTGVESVRQRVVQRIRFRLGSWFLALLRGTPYSPEIFGRQSVLGLATRTITDTILGVEDVTGVSGIESTLNADARIMSYSATVSTIYGPFTMDTELAA